MIFAIVTLVGMIAISGCNKKETYIVTFNANGGSGTMAAQTFTEGEAQALTRNAFTYDGYTFTGWNTVQGGSGASYTDGQTITATADMTLYAQWEKITSGQLNGHDWVDLGLPSGLLWATCNVGSTTPEGYGDYFAWGETAPKNYYWWNSYRYYDGNPADFSDSDMTKYTGSDGLTILEASDDAATANWGAGWRMPTYDELNELINNCTLTWTTQNDVNGRLFTGPNGNSIFLPAAGFRFDSELRYAGSHGYYWSSSLDSDSPSIAWFLGFHSGNYDMWDDGGRAFGESVRAVCQSQN